MNIPLSLLMVASLMLGGCATSGPTYKVVRDQQSGTLVGRNFMVFIPTDKVRISFVEIDGLLVRPSTWTGPLEEVPVAAGQHKVTFGLEGFEFVFAQDQVELNVEPGHRYKFHARKVGIAFDVQVIDEQTGATVFNRRVAGSKGSAPAFVPIFIPAR